MSHGRHRLFDAKRRNIWTAMRGKHLVYMFRVTISVPVTGIQQPTACIEPWHGKAQGGN